MAEPLSDLTVLGASSRSYTNDYETSSEYSDPSDRRVGRSRYTIAEDDDCAIDDEAADDPMAVSDSMKLKGVYWPGMDMFDSATPEMRRKRNQKKDSSVVEQLELNSQDVEATELIFTPTGSFKRQRRISSSVYDDDEDEMIKLESPTPSLARPALASLDVNASRRQRRGTRAQPFHVGRGSYEDEHTQSELGSTYGDRAPKRKRKIDIFHDDEISSFGHPAPFNALTAGFHGQLSPTPAPIVPTYKAFGHPPLQFDHRIENKENIMPTLHPSAYENHHAHQPAAFHYPSYAYGLAQDHPALQYNQLYMPMHGYHPSPDEDDSRTLTAPPSPSTT